MPARLLSRFLLGAALAGPALQAAAAEAQGSPPAILVSRQLSERAGLKPGDGVRLSAHASGKDARDFRVAGIYEPRPDPMRITSERFEVRLHLPDLLELSAEPGDPASQEAVSAINVALRDPSDAAAFARDLSAKLPGLVVREIAPREDDDNPFLVLKRFHLAISVITLLASTIFLLALMVMLVEERRETIGMLRLIGFKKRRIVLQVFAEGLLIAALGALFGVVLAGALQGVFNRFFQWRYDTTLVFVRVTPEIAWRCVLLSLPFGMFASLVSSWGLLRRQIIALARR
jgi:putative ABC transport system permease protein